MSTRSTPYSDKFRDKIVEQYESGRSVCELADEFEPCEATIRNWNEQHELDSGQRDDGLTSDEKEELKRLRPENRKLKKEREILKKATAWKAGETEPTTNNGSSSS